MNDSNTPERRDWKSHPSWEFWGVVIGTILSLVALFCGWYFFIREHEVKSLSYGVVSSGPLVSVKSDVARRVRVIFDGVPVRDLKISVLRVVNSGNVPITKQDFEKPIQFVFGKQTRAKVLDASISQTAPADMGAALKLKRVATPIYWHSPTARPGQAFMSMHPDTPRSVTSVYSLSSDVNPVTIEPGLLNPGDSITLRVLLTGGDGEITANARIIGVSTLSKTDFTTQKQQDPLVRLFSWINGIGALIAIFIAVCFAVTFILGEINTNAVNRRNRRNRRDR